MEWIDYVYYCIYRFVLKTPDRSGAEVWPIVFLALALWIHGLTVYFVFTQVTGMEIATSAVLKKIGVGAMILTMLFFFWRYVIQENSARVISSFEKRGNERKYARVGMIMFIETLLLPLVLVCLVLVWTKLK
jgi:hypothetical protein